MTLQQGRLPLGLEERALRGEPSAIARALESHPCAGCGGPVVEAHDATSGAPITLDPGPRAYFVIGERRDGRPLVALTSNGIMPHICTTRRAS